MKVSVKRKYVYAAAALLAVAVTSISLFFSSGRMSSPEPGSIAAWERFSDEAVPGLLAESMVPGLSMALVSGGQLVWSGAWGVAEIESGRSMTVDTRCRVESISKSVTAYGVIELVRQGLLDLDRPAAEYLDDWRLPDTSFNEEEITVRRLLNQTSGMPLGTIGVCYPPEGSLPSLEQHLRTEAVLVREPGTAFSYSNAGYNLLELIVEKVSGESFAEYMRRAVLKPLGMKASDFIWSPGWEPAVPDGHDLNNSPVPVYVYPDKASGGLFATSEDIAVFLSSVMKDPLMSDLLYSPSAELTGYYSAVFDEYGFGHFIETLPDGNFAVSHGGQGTGWMTHFHSVPGTGDGIVLLSNSQRSWPMFSLLLSHWAEWSGHRSVGMGLIAAIRNILKAAIMISIFLLAAGLYFFTADLYKEQRKALWRGGRAGFRHYASLVTALGAAAVVVYISRLDYFFLSSVFPVETPSLGRIILFWCALLMLKTLFPAVKEKETVS